jgi:hypothetical protein
MKPLPGWTGPVFELSQDYPKSQPKPEAYPWKQYDFRTQWREYAMSVLQYCSEGNLEVDWVVQKNKVRRWYHAPWLHWGLNGREFIHGLTRERVTEPKELAPTQTSEFQNWAVGMYNAPGGYVIGRVWRNPQKPDPSQAKFPDGTAAVKLLFTEASVDQVPYLKGSKEWQAYIYQDVVTPLNPLVSSAAAPDMPRVVKTLRLLQIDIAVRDSRADATTGWVFGTFTYNASIPGNTDWDRIVPVGLMWGNDPGVTAEMVQSGTKLQETIINPSPDLPRQHLGWGGRLNGPVDNPMSSCLSCHSTGQFPTDTPLLPPTGVTPGSQEWMGWFRNVKAGEPFSPGHQSLNYSLQLASGIQKFNVWKALADSRGGAFNAAPEERAAGRSRRLHPVTRQGDEPSVPESPVEPATPAESPRRSMRSWAAPMGALVPFGLALFFVAGRRGIRFRSEAGKGHGT